MPTSCVPIRPARLSPDEATTAAAAPESERRFSVVLQLDDLYRQIADFGLDGVPPLVVDEPPPLGTETGPNPARLLGAAVGSCLGASLLFCLRRSHVDVTDLRTTVEGTMIRNEHGRLRIGSLRVSIVPTVAEADRARLGRCMGLFEDFCVVTESVRAGIDVEVEVSPSSGAQSQVGS